MRRLRQEEILLFGPKTSIDMFLEDVQKTRVEYNTDYDKWLTLQRKWNKLSICGMIWWKWSGKWHKELLKALLK